ncbi:MAG TPA: hypothetical protein VK718_01665 [Ferruginibacter sp.]|nr:hypothetical protein [Ferruginibacter sp.]
MNSLVRGLFINNKKAQDSIYESGYLVYECLLQSKQYQLDYIEIDINNREIKTGYDFYFFNYHLVTMAWLETKFLKKELGFVITMVLEVAPDDAFVLCPEKDFTVYCALDPSLQSKQKNLFAFPRPLTKINFELPVITNEIPVIGSFGFGTKGKGFQHVVEAVNKEFDKAIIRINIPYGDFIPESKKYAFYLGEVCKQKAKPGIEVRVTHDFMNREELIKWCNANTLNCFLYDRNMPGLSATTDQAIVTRQPMSVSNNDTFRHITAYLPPYPSFSLKDSIKKSSPLIKKMNDDWQSEKFTERFEEVLNIYTKDIAAGSKTSGVYTLPIKTKTIIDTIARRLKRYKRKIKKLNFSKLLTIINKKEII